MLKSVCVISALALLGACSHHRPQKSSRPSRVGQSFFGFIKTKKYTNPAEENRYPASSKTIPGLKEFITDLRANPAFLKAPVGFEVVAEETYVEGGTPERFLNKTIYLKENFYGSFSFESEDGQEKFDFVLQEKNRVEDVEYELTSQDLAQSFKKVSSKKYIMTFKFPETMGEVSCEMQLDLTKSGELSEHLCTDKNGAVISQKKIISVKAVNVKDYVSSLKSIKLEVRPNALQCFESSEDQVCSDSVRDEQEKDWSYLLK
jgi:hypothetical protein